MASGPDLTNPELWFARDGAGYVLTDPVQGEPINPTVVPGYIDGDPLLHAGLEFMRNRGQDNTHTITYVRHYLATDLGNLQRRWYENQVGAADYFGYEMYACDANNHFGHALKQRNLLVGTNGTFEAYAAERAKRYESSLISEFVARRDYGIAVNPSTPSFSFDLPRANGTPIEQSLFRAFERTASAPTTEENAVAVCGIMHAREWCMVARTGVELLRGELGKDPRPLDVFMVVGGEHRHLTEKFRAVGARVLGKSIKVVDGPSAGSQEFMRTIIQTGAVRRSEIFAAMMVQAGLPSMGVGKADGSI